jgi:hypothetical protein
MNDSSAGETADNRGSSPRHPGRENLQPRRPFEAGNDVAVRHGFYVSQLAPSEAEEVQAIADVIRELSPIHGEALEPLVQGLAGKLWRRKQAYADLVEHDVVRGRDRSPAPILADLNTPENSIRRDLAALALTVEAAAEVGVKLSRASKTGRQIDVSRLTDDELDLLRRLVDKAEGETS